MDTEAKDRHALYHMIADAILSRAVGLMGDDVPGLFVGWHYVWTCDRCDHTRRIPLNQGPP